MPWFTGRTTLPVRSCTVELRRVEMKSRDYPNSNMLVSVAVRAALIAAIAAPPITFAQEADSDEVKALTSPTNFLQLGGAYTSEASDKFGEYNGLYKAGAIFIGDLRLAGGDAY